MKPGRIIVVGGNAAGPAAAAKAKRINPSAKVTLFEAGNYISTGTCEIPYVLSGEIKNHEKLIFNTAETFLNKKGVHVFINHLVEGIDRRNKTILVRDIKSNQISLYQYDSLILATGSYSKIPPGFSTELSNVFTLKNIQELIGIKNYLESNSVKHISIIGSGYIGLEAADTLSQLGLDIVMLEKQSAPLPEAEPEISQKIRETLLKHSIKFVGGIETIDPFIKDDKVISLKRDEESYETDLVIIATGISPNVNLAANAKLEIGNFNGIKVDRKLRTSDRNILAAGDNIEVVNAITGKNDYLPFATYAHTQGHIAGENAAGGNANADPVIKNVSIKVFDDYFSSVGLNSKYTDDVRFKVESVSAVVLNLVSVMPLSREVYGKLIYDKESKKILGASFYGGAEVSGYADLISSAIYSGQKIDFLTKINYNYTPPLSPFINLLSVLGRKAVNNSTN
ncbi:MAG: FAD-dependent oxidoreductase [Ignavibacteria bacterium]|jgi:NADPH-dependent 2,4-dienoyl-CoA reductase/sulfur reductase-like enzyme